MGCFAVVDIETNWENEIISIGVVIADSRTYNAISSKYYVIEPTYKLGGMYAYALNLNDKGSIICERKTAIKDILLFLKKYDVSSIFAYNATFDYQHLPELHSFFWYDIMSIAAYKQYNHSIPITAECCNTGRLKRGYGVEHIMQMLMGNKRYYETHNALQDAIDELQIMRLLNVDIKMYKCL